MDVVGPFSDLSLRETRRIVYFFEMHCVVSLVQGEHCLHLEEEVVQLVSDSPEHLGRDALFWWQVGFGSPPGRANCFAGLCYLSIDVVFQVALPGCGVIPI